MFYVALATLFTFSFSFFTLPAAQAQAPAQSDLSRQLEVTRAYTPKVGRAVKIDVEPNMTDTVRLRPEGDFRITPTAWPGTFPLKKLAPANISTASYAPRQRFYLRAGLSYPLGSVVDFYYTPIADNRRTVGVFANHVGSFSKVKTDLGLLADNVETASGAGIFGTKRFRDERTVDGDLFFEGRYYSYYGSGDNLDPEEIPAITPLPGQLATRQIGSRLFDYSRSTDTYFLGKIGGGVNFGDTFADLSRFNFRVGVGTGFTVYTLPFIGDRGGGPTPDKIDVDFQSRMAMMPHRNHGFEILLSERGVVSPVEANEISAVAVDFSPRYLLKISKLNVAAGFDTKFIYNGLYSQRRVAFAPVLEAKYDIFGGRSGGGSGVSGGAADDPNGRSSASESGQNESTNNALGISASSSGNISSATRHPWAGALVPFVSVGSRLLDGSFEVLSRRNTYIDAGAAGPTGTATDVRIGIAGNVHDIFTYRLGGGVSWLRDYQIFIAEYDVRLSVNNSAPTTYHADYSPVIFYPMGVRGRFYTVGVQLGLLPLRGFSASFGANWNRFDLRDGLPADLPDYDVNASLSYSYKGLFSISAAAKLIGPRHFLNSYTITPPGSVQPYSNTRLDHIRPVVDLSAKVEVKATKRLWIFAEGGNLLGRRLYPYGHYPGGRANITLGVKTVF